MFVNKITPIMPISISYRDEGKGQGAFYDHYTISRATKRKTVLIKSTGLSDLDFISYIKQSPFSLVYSNYKTEHGKNYPETAPLYGDGLLVIPGRSREIESKRPIIHQNRTEFEQKAIQDALLRGRPILAICAGSWVLWQQLSSKASLMDVSDHNYGAGMPRIKQNGDIGFNKMIHRIKVSQSSMLSDMMHISKRLAKSPYVENYYPVNSVHWKSVDAATLPNMVMIAATSIQDDSLAPESRQATKMKPTKDSVEAFERESGAPVLGIQWHPEAFNTNDSVTLYPEKQHGILKFMAQAGDAYEARNNMVREFKTLIESSKLHGYGFFTRKNSVDTVVDKISVLKID